MTNLSDEPGAAHRNPHSEYAVPASGKGKWGCLFFLLLLAVAGVGGVVYSHIKQNEKDAQAEKKGVVKAIPISEAKVIKQDVPIEIRVVGDVSPYTTVPVTPQIGGQLMKVWFKTGDFVKKGQRLFTIDPRPLQASLDQARATIQKDRAMIQQSFANITRDKATVRMAQATLQRDVALIHQAVSNKNKDVANRIYASNEDVRYQKLLGLGYATVEQAEGERSTAQQLENTVAADIATVASTKSTVDADKATIQSDQATVEADMATITSAQASLKSDTAALENSTVQLGYTDIRSPINGRTGTLNIFEGTVVPATSTTPLITIDQISPIYVQFSVPERYLPQIRDYQRRGALKVTTEPTDPGEARETGSVSFIENTVDNTTGTIVLRATFPNKAHTLWPGHFVNVNLFVSMERGALLVPTPAVQPSQQGDAVFVVKSDNTVELRPVKVKFTHGDMSVIESGLKEGEMVVTDGQLQLTPGATVKTGGRHEGGGSKSLEESSTNSTTGPDASASPDEHRHHRHKADASATPAASVVP